MRDTPTCVGKRELFKKVLANVGGHPHVCGEEA